MSATERSACSGQQIEIRHGGQRAVVVEVGGGLREYEVDGRPVLDGYAFDALADGQYTFDGQELRLPIDDVVRGNAMHGLTRWLNWNVVEQATDRVRVALIVHPRTGFPFTLELSIEYSLDHTGLTVRTTARNGGQRALPFGAGQHPYVTAGGPLVDSAHLQLPARAMLELDAERRLPTGKVVPLAGLAAYDFRTARPVGALVLDECFTELDRGDDGVARVRLSDPATRAEVSMWMDASYRYVQVFSGDTLAAARQRRSLAIEPMTCPPNAFRTGVDLIVLQPGQSCSLAWGLGLTDPALTNP